MAEKEERILVLKATEDDFIYKHFNGNGFVPRAEVVERMAKEMARLYCPEKPTKKEFESIWEYELLLSTQKHFKELAQAALDALLEK